MLQLLEKSWSRPQTSQLQKLQCTKIEKGPQCIHYHHPSLHKSNTVNIGVASLHENEEVMLPAQVSLIRQEAADSVGLKEQGSR